MGIFDSKSTKFQPDFRDTILYNGQIEFIFTGNFVRNYLELINSKGQKILFNTNLKKEEYIKNHNNFNLIRSKGKTNFMEILKTNSGEHFFPTGRIYQRPDIQNPFWEIMKKDDPLTVLFLELPILEDYIIGKRCLSKK